MFHISKHETTETTWQSLFCHGVDAETDLNNMNKTVVTYCPAFMVGTEHNVTVVDSACQPSWVIILVAQHVVHNQSQWYIHKFTYSRHKSGEFYVIKTAVLNRALCVFEYTHQKTFHDQKTHIFLTEMGVNVEKSGELQRRLERASLSHMDNRRKDSKHV